MTLRAGAQSSRTLAAQSDGGLSQVVLGAVERSSKARSDKEVVAQSIQIRRDSLVHIAFRDRAELNESAFRPAADRSREMKKQVS